MNRIGNMLELSVVGCKHAIERFRYPCRKRCGEYRDSY